jgi:hypothetical protein
VTMTADGTYMGMMNETLGNEGLDWDGCRTLKARLTSLRTVSCVLAKYFFLFPCG